MDSDSTGFRYDNETAWTGDMGKDNEATGKAGRYGCPFASHCVLSPAFLPSPRVLQLLVFFRIFPLAYLFTHTN